MRDVYSNLLLQLEIEVWQAANPDWKQYEDIIKQLLRQKGIIDENLPLKKGLSKALKYAKKISKKIKEDMIKEIIKLRSKK